MVAETEPGCRMPMPTAPAPWSPAPAATGVPAFSPVSPAAVFADARANLRRLVDPRQPALFDSGSLGDFL